MRKRSRQMQHKTSERTYKHPHRAYAHGEEHILAYCTIFLRCVKLYRLGNSGAPFAGKASGKDDDIADKTGAS